MYASYTIHGGPGSDMRSIVTRFHSSDGGKTVGEETTVIAPFDQPFTNHKGGHIGFGPDGFLYVGFGDGGSGGDPLKHGQNTNLLFSKILRVDVDGPAPYGIPNDNPFKNGGGAPETFAYGFRNPWRWSFDRGTGDLRVGDVGQDIWEEIDVVKRGGNSGASSHGKPPPIVAPGDPSHSVISLRTHALDEKRMPPLASRVVDTEGTGLLDEWIRSLTVCPAN